MSNTLPEALRRLENSFKERAAQRSMLTGPATPAIAKSVPAHVADLAQLPLFEQSTRKGRPYMKGEFLTVPGIGRISYRGQELRGDDWAVWGQLIALARQKNASSDWLVFSPFTILRALSWGIGRSDRARLRACLERMQATVLRLPGEQPNAWVSLSLISQCEWTPSSKGRSGCWRVKIGPEIRTLFANFQMH